MAGWVSEIFKNEAFGTILARDIERRNKTDDTRNQIAANLAQNMGQQSIARHYDSLRRQDELDFKTNPANISKLEQLADADAQAKIRYETMRMNDPGLIKADKEMRKRDALLNAEIAAEVASSPAGKALAQNKLEDEKRTIEMRLEAEQKLRDANYDANVKKELDLYKQKEAIDEQIAKNKIITQLNNKLSATRGNTIQAQREIIATDSEMFRTMQEFNKNAILAEKPFNTSYGNYMVKFGSNGGYELSLKDSPDKAIDMKSIRGTDAEKPIQEIIDAYAERGMAAQKLRPLREKMTALQRRSSDLSKIVDEYTQTYNTLAQYETAEKLQQYNIWYGNAISTAFNSETKPEMEPEKESISDEDALNFLSDYAYGSYGSSRSEVSDKNVDLSNFVSKNKMQSLTYPGTENLKKSNVSFDNLKTVSENKNLKAQNPFWDYEPEVNIDESAYLMASPFTAGRVRAKE